MLTLGPRGRRAAIFATALTLLFFGSAWAGWESLAAASPPAAVTIDSFSFGPGTVTVPRGTTVTWTNKDDDTHTVTSASDPKLFKSPALDTDQTFTFTFNQAGTFKYYCSIHPYMQGTVIVQ